MTSPFFVVGPPKTGTTVLTRLLVQHPEVTCISESYILDPESSASLVQPAGHKWEIHGFTRGHAERWQAVFRQQPTPRALRAVPTDAWAEMREKTSATVVGDSWPFYGLHLPTVMEAFPDAKLIYTTRDPRAVFWSGQTFMGRGQGEWNSALLLRIDREARRTLSGGSAWVVPYEALVQNPREVVRSLWAKMGLDPSAGWIDYARERDPWPERWSWIPNATEPLDGSRIDRWSREMPEACRRIVGLAAAEYCQLWGYPVALADRYQASEFVDAFVAGAHLEHLPRDVEQYVRADLLLTRRACRELQAKPRAREEQ